MQQALAMRAGARKGVRKTMTNSFEDYLSETQGNLGASRFRGPTIDVADTMYACKRWFEGYAIPFTAADVVAMAALVLQREREERKREEHALSAERDV